MRTKKTKGPKNPLGEALVAPESAERGKVEAALREDRARYRSLIETTSDFIWEVDPEGKYTYCSSQMEVLWGLNPESMIGKTPFDQMPPGPREEGIAYYRGIVQSKSPFRGIRVPSLDGRGHLITIEISGVPFFDSKGQFLGYRGVTRDVTESERTQKELAAREALLRALTENSPDAIYVKDARSRWLMANPAVLRIVGKSAEEALGKTDLELYADPAIGRAILENDRRILAGKRAETFEELADTPDGRRLFLSTKAPWTDSKGNVIGLIGISRDITDRKKTEEALRESQKQSEVFANLLRSSDQPFGSGYADGRLGVVNRAFEKLVGYTEEELRTINWKDLTPAEWIERETAVLAELERTGVPVRYEKEYIRKDGTRVPIELLCHLVKDQNGGPEHYYSFVTDLTDRKRAEEALRKSEERYRLLVQHAPAGIFELDLAAGRFSEVNEVVCRILGYSRDEFLALNPFDLLDEEGRARFSERIRQGGPGTVNPEAAEYRVRRKDGEFVWALVNATYQLEPGMAKHATVVAYDISDRKRAELALGESEKRFRDAFESSPIDMALIRLDGSFIDVNDAAVRMHGFSSKAELLAKNCFDLVDQEYRRTAVEAFEKMSACGHVSDVELVQLRKDGHKINTLVSATLMFAPDGRPAGFLAMVMDISARKRAEELRMALAEQDKLRLGAAVEQASGSLVMVDLDGTIRYVNAAFESINKVTRAEAVGTSYFALLGGEPAAEGAIREAVAAGRTWHGSLTRPIRDGRPIDLEVTISYARDASGAAIGGLITERDVTRENALQNQVRQAQKMEALGTLAGGITHDFNNILGTIVLNTELALLDMSPADPARRPLPLVLQAANRGKELVKQIITFSRQRTWEKKPAAIAPTVIEGMKFLRTTLPKDIRIEESVDGKSGVVLADPSHINQILVNLCQNAALAMQQGGGTLRVDLAPVEIDEAMILRYPNLRPGPYVHLSVSDTGCGMTKEIRERIFEPFFTTRSPGEGSGLGLAVVHGIVRTYDGEITVESEPGKGSRFGVYFPRVEADVPRADIEKKDRPQRGTERILLVEDEEGQRESFRHGLGSLGYKVTAATDGLEALVAFQRDPAAFDVVVTDQIMPRMTGLELASEITAVRPGFPVILCTGFSEKVNAANVDQSGVRELLMKPFTLRDASRLIRKVLD